MELQNRIQQFHISLNEITWVSFVIIFSLFAGYAFLLQQKERSVQDMLRHELQVLRKENQQLLDQNQQLEQTCISVHPEQHHTEPSSDVSDHNPELEQANQRSFLYTVRKGDTIWDIAAIYNIDVKSLMRWNNLTPRSRIFPGDQLTIILEE